MSTLIKNIGNANSEGVSFTLTEKAAVDGRGMPSVHHRVSWDKIGKALFGDQYFDAETVAQLKYERGEK